MDQKTCKPKKASVARNAKSDVDGLLEGLDHPLKAEINAVRTIILGSDPRIEEGVKWNAPSFFFEDWFATFNLRAKTDVQVILHTGAKVKASSVEGLEINDPGGLLKWLAKDRCLLTLSNMSDIQSKEALVTDIIRQWVSHM